MKSETETTGIFGLRYLEEEEVDVTEVVGCQSLLAQTQREVAPGAEPSYYYTGMTCDKLDTD